MLFSPSLLPPNPTQPTTLRGTQMPVFASLVPAKFTPEHHRRKREREGEKLTHEKRTQELLLYFEGFWPFTHCSILMTFDQRGCLIHYIHFPKKIYYFIPHGYEYSTPLQFFKTVASFPRIRIPSICILVLLLVLSIPLPSFSQIPPPFFLISSVPYQFSSRTSIGLINVPYLQALIHSAVCLATTLFPALWP